MPVRLSCIQVKHSGKVTFPISGVQKGINHNDDFFLVPRPSDVRDDVKPNVPINIFPQMGWGSGGDTVGIRQQNNPNPSGIR